MEDVTCLAHAAAPGVRDNELRLPRRILRAGARTLRRASLQPPAYRSRTDRPRTGAVARRTPPCAPPRWRQHGPESAGPGRTAPHTPRAYGPHSLVKPLLAAT